MLDHGSFSAAARALLGRVPSAVSMAIAQPEAELDLPLFDRTGPRAAPNVGSEIACWSRRRGLIDAQLKALQVQALGLDPGAGDHASRSPSARRNFYPRHGAKRWRRSRIEHPLLEVEVLAAPQADALAMLHTGRAQLALVFERPSLDGREGFQEVATEMMVSVIAPTHPVLLAAGGRLREQHLTNTRQIVVAGRDLATSDPRFVFARQHLAHRQRTRSAELDHGRIGMGMAAPQLCAAACAGGCAGRDRIREPLQRARPVGRTWCGPRNGRWAWARSV